MASALALTYVITPVMLTNLRVTLDAETGQMRIQKPRDARHDL